MDIKERAGLRTVILPAHDGVVPGISDLENITDEQDIQYNTWCNEFITRSLREVEDDNQKQIDNWDISKFGPMPVRLERAMVRTRYPKDDDGSEDVVALDEDGKIVIIDAGTS